MKRNWRNHIATVVVILFGIILLYVGTDGFHAFTKESARIHALSEEKPEIPDVTLEDSKGREYLFSEFSGDYLLVTFVYTNCTTVCPLLETNFSEVYDLIPDKYIGTDLNFLTISFDPENDDPETLEKYRTYFDSDGETWRMARVNDEEELQELLDTLDIVVIPDGEGDFSHNVAFYLIDPSGYLQEIYDFQEIEETAEKVESLVGDKARDS
ncbi:MAG TPA: SCO family protein [Virgibacillus sp.]|nr:SCO family protein [Virgibacillus sp.]